MAYKNPYFTPEDIADPFPPAWIYGNQPSMDAATAWNLLHLKRPPGPDDFSTPPKTQQEAVRDAITTAILSGATQGTDVKPAYLPGGGQPGGADAGTTTGEPDTGTPEDTGTPDQGSRQPTPVETPPQEKETPEQQAPQQSQADKDNQETSTLAPAVTQQTAVPQGVVTSAPIGPVQAPPSKGFVGFQQSDMPDIDQPNLTPYGIPTAIQNSPLKGYEPMVPDVTPPPTLTPEAPKGLPDVDPLGQPLGTPNIGTPQGKSLAQALAEKGEVQSPIGAPVTQAEQHDMDKATLAQLATLAQQAEVDKAITDIAEQGVEQMGPPPDVQQSVQEAVQADPSTTSTTSPHGSQTAAENALGLTGPTVGPNGAPQSGLTAASLAAAADAMNGVTHGSQTAVENALGLTTSAAPTPAQQAAMAAETALGQVTGMQHGSQTAVENALGLTTPAQKGTEKGEVDKSEVDQAVQFALAQLALEDPQTAKAPVMAMDVEDPNAKADPNTPEGRAQTFADQAAFETAVSGILGHQFGQPNQTTTTAVTSPTALSALADAMLGLQGPTQATTQATPEGYFAAFDSPQAMNFADALQATLADMNQAPQEAPDDTSPDTSTTGTLAEAVSPTLGFSDAEAAAVAEAAANLGAPSEGEDDAGDDAGDAGDAGDGGY